MNINKYIEQAYAFFKGLATEMAKIVKTGNEIVTEGLVEAKTAIVETTTVIDEHGKAITYKLDDVIKAIEDKPVVESVEISNLSELIQGIDGVIETLKTELAKIDKEIVVKNDLSQLTALFKSGEDKKDLVKALKRIEDGVKEEKPDYTLILDELVTLVEKIEAKEVKEIDLSGVQDMLAQISVGVNTQIIPNETFTSDKRIRVELSDKQLSKIGGSVSVSSGSNSLPIVEALAGKATEVKQDTQITLQSTLNTLITTLNGLTESNQELQQRLAFLGSIKQHQTESLRVTSLTGSTTAVTGSLTSAGTVTTVGAITNFGTGYPATEVSHDINNSTAILANIQNVVVT